MQYIEKTKNLISQKAGVDPKEIKMENYLEDDLNLGELEIAELLGEIEESFEIELDGEETFETVEDLIGAISEKLE